MKSLWRFPEWDCYFLKEETANMHLQGIGFEESRNVGNGAVLCTEIQE
jgi:hypothetical protein